MTKTMNAWVHPIKGLSITMPAKRARISERPYNKINATPRCLAVFSEVQPKPISARMHTPNY